MRRPEREEVSVAWARMERGAATRPPRSLLVCLFPPYARRHATLRRGPPPRALATGVPCCTPRRKSTKGIDDVR